MAKKISNKDYFGLGYVASLILVIIPVTNCVCSFITRWRDGKPLVAILRLLLSWNIIWILDIISMVLKHKIFRLF